MQIIETLSALNKHRSYGGVAFVRVKEKGGRGTPEIATAADRLTTGWSVDHPSGLTFHVVGPFGFLRPSNSCCCAAP